jgi:hypothetical protein
LLRSAAAHDLSRLHSSRTSLKRGPHLAPHVIDRALSPNGDDQAFPDVALDDRLGLSVVDRESLLDRFARVIDAAFLSTRQEPIHADVVRELEVEDNRKWTPNLVEKPVEVLGLRDRARKAVQDEALLGAQSTEALADQLDGQGVGNELACGDDGLDLKAYPRASGDCCSEDLSRFYVREAGTRTPSASPASPCRNPVDRARARSRPEPPLLSVPT